MRVVSLRGWLQSIFTCRFQVIYLREKSSKTDVSSFFTDSRYVQHPCRRSSAMAVAVLPSVFRRQAYRLGANRTQRIYLPLGIPSRASLLLPQGLSHNGNPAAKSPAVFFARQSGLTTASATISTCWQARGFARDDEYASETDTEAQVARARSGAVASKVSRPKRRQVDRNR